MTLDTLILNIYYIVSIEKINGEMKYLLQEFFLMYPNFVSNGKK